MNIIFICTYSDAYTHIIYLYHIYIILYVCMDCTVSLQDGDAPEMSQLETRHHSCDWQNDELAPDILSCMFL